jgi:PAS domain S-box-containing protein
MGRKISLLLIEDSEPDAELLLHQLEKGGFEVKYKRLETSEDMKRALKNQKWDIVISDYVLPEFDGLSAWKVLQKSGLDLPFIIVSGKIGEDAAVDAMRSGVHDYIMKSNMKRLIPAVERELAEAEIRKKHHEAQEEKQKLEAQYRLVVDNASEGIAIIQDEKFKFINPMIAQVLGRPVNEVLGIPVEKYVHEEDRDPIMKLHRQRIKSSSNIPDPQSFRIQREDGKVRWIEVHAVSVIWEGKAATLNFMTDITERKKTENLLLETKTQLEIDQENLRKKNIALSEVLDQIKTEKENIKKEIALNIESRVKNTILRLREIAPPDMQTYLDMLDKDLDDIASPFMDKMKNSYSKLSSRQLEICYLIKNGMRSKEIAMFLNISEATVNKHRELIRKKLDIVGSDKNLSSFLQTIEEPDGSGS